MNPFKYGQIVQDKDFCRRPDLQKTLAAYIRRGQNVYVQGERRIGKSSLICETARKLTKYRMIYVDFLEIKTIEDIIKRILYAIVSMPQSGVLEKLLINLSHFRPKMTVDPITGLPSFSFDVEKPLLPDSIHGIMELIASRQTKNRPIVVVFDEFQDILNLKEAKETLALLRSRIQFHSTICYVFSGSVRNKMVQIFSDPESPFFKSAVAMEVGPLQENIFKKFLKDKFAAGKRGISKEILDQVFAVCSEVPGDLQQLCGALWDVSPPGDDIAGGHVAKALQLIFANEYKGYETVLKIVSGQQLKILVGLAKWGGKAPTSSQFLREVGIPQASSVKTALMRLVDLKIIFFHDAEYRFVNPYFKAWLIYKNY